jgi:hypothetical protein
MSTLPIRMLRGITLVVLALAVASLAQAQGISPHRRMFIQQRPATFTVSGVFTGAALGRTTINDVDYSVCASPQVYQIGVGMIPLSSVAIGSRIYASGVGSPSSGTICMMIVRPDTEETAAGHDLSSHIRVRDHALEQ